MLYIFFLDKRNHSEALYRKTFAQSEYDSQDLYSFPSLLFFPDIGRPHISIKDAETEVICKIACY